MKKLLLVALVAISGFSMVEARRGCSSGRCETSSCEPKCVKPEPVCCIRQPHIVGCTQTYDEGPKPDVCGAVPAPRDIEKHVHTSISYSCVDNPCAAPITEDQLNFFKSIGSVRDTTCCQ